MTLDKRIKKDLIELYNGGKVPETIQGALALDGLIQVSMQYYMGRVAIPKLIEYMDMVLEKGWTAAYIFPKIIIS